jgi:hypothetical protein
MTTQALSNLVNTYYQLSCIEQPSSQDLDKIQSILELAQYDEELSTLINEADHKIAE